MAWDEEEKTARGFLRGVVWFVGFAGVALAGASIFTGNASFLVVYLIWLGVLVAAVAAYATVLGSISLALVSLGRAVAWCARRMRRFFPSR
ncbi:MAG TPA: hypothetical protein VMW35_14400 [Myxococcota bacterium]|nr:hypothetical protein [Myxococcota bacterium]